MGAFWCSMLAGNSSQELELGTEPWYSDVASRHPNHYVKNVFPLCMF